MIHGDGGLFSACQSVYHEEHGSYRKMAIMKSLGQAAMYCCQNAPQNLSVCTHSIFSIAHGICGFCNSFRRQKPARDDVQIASDSKKNQLSSMSLDKSFLGTLPMPRCIQLSYIQASYIQTSTSTEIHQSSGVQWFLMVAIPKQSRCTFTLPAAWLNVVEASKSPQVGCVFKRLSS